MGGYLVEGQIVAGILVGSAALGSAESIVLVGGVKGQIAFGSGNGDIKGCLGEGAVGGHQEALGGFALAAVGGAHQAMARVVLRKHIAEGIVADVVGLGEIFGAEELQGEAIAL